MKKIKALLEDLCVWVLGRLNIQRLKQLTIDDKRIVIGISKFIPDDNKWHGVNVNVNYSIKITSKRKNQASFDDIALYIDGRKRLKRKLK